MIALFVVGLACFASGMLYLKYRWDSEHKWPLALYIFTLGGIACVYPYTEGSMSQTVIPILAVSAAIFWLVAVAEQVEEVLRRSNSPSATFKRGLLQATIAFIIAGIAYIQVLAWIWPNGTENWRDFTAFFVSLAVAGTIRLAFVRRSLRRAPEANATAPIV